MAGCNQVAMVAKSSQHDPHYAGKHTGGGMYVMPEGA